MALIARALAVVAIALVAAPAPAADERPLRVGTARAWPPHQFVDAKGHATGFDVELFRAAAAVAGLRYEFVVGEWPALRPMLERGEIDLVPGVFETARRDSVMDFSVPTVWVHHTVFVRKDSRIERPADLLAGTRVLIREAGPYDDIADEIPGQIELVRGVTAEELLLRLAAGEADAAVTLDTLGLWAIRERGLSNLRSIGQPLDTMQLRFAVPEGRAELLAQLNDALAELRRDGSYDRLWDRWFGVLQPKGVPLRQVLTALGAAFALLVLALWWAGALRTEVAERNERLAVAEVEKRALEQRIAQGEKLEALGRMAVGVAHDFRNVLTAVSGNVELARTEPGLPPAARDALDDAEAATHAAAALVENLVAFGSRGHAERRRTTWEAIASACATLLRPHLPAAVTYDAAFDAGAGTIEVDPAQGQQIVMNLVLNARDALAGRGRIEVRAERVERDGAAWSELVVCDDGPGIEAATRERVFEPFASTKGHGRGIGLATVLAIAERHGGTVEVESQPGAGSCFRVRLPAVDAD